MIVTRKWPIRIITVTALPQISTLRSKQPLLVPYPWKFLSLCPEPEHLEPNFDRFLHVQNSVGNGKYQFEKNYNNAFLGAEL